MTRPTHHLIGIAVLSLAPFAPALHAQTTSSAPPASAAKPADADKKESDETPELEKIEVTGSRIRTLGGEATALPVFTLTQVDLEHRGVERLADIRWAIPQLGAAVGFNDNLLNGGTSRAQQVGTSFNLRGLGGNSTLVLVDGRRIPHTGQEAPGGAGGREDFSVDGIPISAIERIEVLPEGAGAIYGSEAIAGVVNIVLKKNYTGAELRVAYDNTFDTDVAQTTVSLTAGYRVKKLSLFLTAAYENQNGMAARDRWFTATNDSRVFGSTSTNFLANVASGPGSLSSTASPQNTGQANLPGLTTNIVGIPAGSNGSTAANTAFSATVPPPFDGALYAMSIDPARRKNLVFKADYQIATRTQIYAEGRLSRFDNFFTSTPNTLSVSLPAGYPGNPFSTPVFLRKVFYDLPRLETNSRQENLGAALGVRGQFRESWRYDASASWSRNIVSDDAIAGGFNFTLLGAAMASANRPLLAYDSFNGRDPNAPGVLAALMPVADHKDTTDVTQYLITTDGNVWHGWAGDIRAAVGVEAGEEKVKFWREPSIVTPTFVLTRPFSRELTAAFAEVSVPLLGEAQKLPLVHRLEIGGAIRATDYSDIGGVTTPTYRALYQPVKWLTLRASRAEGFKPVRLYDLLGPVTTGLTTLTTASNVRDNRRGGELVLGTFTRSFGGNPTLKPEVSVSRNAGVVLDVPGRWLKGLSLSADYYEFEFSDRSGGPGNQVLFDFFPERVTRAAPTPADIAAGYAGVITTWDATNINLAGVTTKGWDYRLRYERKFSFGDLSFHAAVSDPDVTFTKATPAAVPTSTFGHQPRRSSASLFLNHGAWDGGVSVNHQNRFFINGLTTSSYPSYLEWNPQLSYNFGKDPRFNAGATEWWARALSGTKFSLTVVNVFNREPERSDVALGRIVMDPRLRRYVVSASKKF